MYSNWYVPEQASVTFNRSQSTYINILHCSKESESLEQILACVLENQSGPWVCYNSAHK